MVSLLVSITVTCGLLIAVAHVLNRSFLAPTYDVAANLIAFPALLQHPPYSATGHQLCCPAQQSPAG